METLSLLTGEGFYLDSGELFEIDSLNVQGSITGSGELETYQGNLTGRSNISSSVTLTFLDADVTPIFTVTAIGTNYIEIYIENTGSLSYNVLIDDNNSFSSPTTSTFSNYGTHRITGLESGTVYAKITAGSASSTTQEVVIPEDSEDAESFDAYATSLYEISVFFPTVQPVSIHRRVQGGVWSTIASNVSISPYKDDIRTTGNTLEANVKYEYQWKTANSSWLGSNLAWITRTYDKAVVCEEYASEGLLIIVCEEYAVDNSLVSIVAEEI